MTAASDERARRATGKPTVVVVVGGGVAALEAVLALQSLAEGRLHLVVLTSSTEYVVRPDAVRAPFAYPAPSRYLISDVLGDSAEWILDDLDGVDPVAQTLRTAAGTTLGYDALILATGARRSVRYPHAITIDDGRLDDLLHGTIQDIEAEAIHRIAYVAPERMGWPLPLYELALMTAERAGDLGVRLDTLLTTPEDRPLELFGAAASTGVRKLLADFNVELHTSSYAEVPQRRELVLSPGQRRHAVDRVVALPELFGPAIPGLPHDATGFLPIDEYCRVPGAPGVYAAGDCTDHPVKHGGAAAQMAVTAARATAASCLDLGHAQPLDLVIRGILHTGLADRYLTVHRVAGQAFESRYSDDPLWDPPTKISTQFLGPRLEELEARRATIRESPQAGSGRTSMADPRATGNLT